MDRDAGDAGVRVDATAQLDAAALDAIVLREDARADAAADAAVADSAAADVVVADTGSVDAATLDGAAADGGAPDADAAMDGSVDSGLADNGVRVSINGTVVFSDPRATTATVSVIEPAGAATSTVTGPSGGFEVFVPLGAIAMVRADVRHHVSRIQGYQPGLNGDTRDFYMTSTTAVGQIAAVLGTTVSSTTGIVWIDFRNSPVGGYGAILSLPHGASFTLDYTNSDDGIPIPTPNTLSGVPNSELIFLNVPAGRVRVTPLSPGNGPTCVRRDPAIGEWPVLAGVMTQIDFECR